MKSAEAGWVCTFDPKVAAGNYRWAERNRPDAKPLTLWARRCYRAGREDFGFDTYVQWAVCFGVPMEEVRDGHWREIRRAHPEDIAPMTIEQVESLVPAFNHASGHWKMPSQGVER
ncbi:MAG TPA: hypothetical protein VEB23_04510 [Ramlibacter sp.]|nr:hypothetical protein [Ramlibacter sp.]